MLETRVSNGEGRGGSVGSEVRGVKNQSTHSANIAREHQRITPTGKEIDQSEAKRSKRSSELAGDGELKVSEGLRRKFSRDEKLGEAAWGK